MTAPAPAQPPRPAERRRRLKLHPRLALAAALTLAAGAAHAQAAFNAAVDSDYRIRGVSFSDGRPAASLSLSFDDPSGFYVGLTGVVGDTDRSGIKPLGYQAIAGYAVRTREGWSLDAGVSTAAFNQDLDRHRQLQYSEVYAGLTAGGVSAHLYYSPDYLGEKVQTLYGEIDGALELRPNLRLFGHAGLLAPLNTAGASRLKEPRYDLKAGLAVEVKQLEVRLAWSHAQGAYGYPAYLRGGDSITAGATYAF